MATVVIVGSYSSGVQVIATGLTPVQAETIGRLIVEAQLAEHAIAAACGHLTEQHVGSTLHEGAYQIIGDLRRRLMQLRERLQSSLRPLVLHVGMTTTGYAGGQVLDGLPRLAEGCAWQPPLPV